MVEDIFKLIDVEYVYPGGITALGGINLQIQKGDRVVIMGANGSGKSTLLSILDGLIFPCKGKIFAFGRELREATFNDQTFTKFFRSKVGFVFQNPEVQLFCPTVKEDIAFGPLCLGLDVEETSKLVKKVIAELGIEELIERPPHRLSIGEKKKVAIATALIMEPEVLILDEPTAGLDPLTTRHIIEILKKAGQNGVTVITATHDIHIAGEISDIIYILGRDKRIVRSVSPSELFNDVEFLKQHNLLHDHIHKHDISGILHIHEHEHKK
jgi:cobalt/nickel transport system ATP-binding protein